MRNIFSLLLATFYVMGCSSISQPVASRALVEYTFATEQDNVPSTVWQELSNARFGKKVAIDQKYAELGQTYFSANGRTCRTLLWIDANVDALPRVTCKSIQDDSWQYVKPVMSEYIETGSTVEAAQ
jgi:hypothetical protein